MFFLKQSLANLFNIIMFVFHLIVIKRERSFLKSILIMVLSDHDKFIFPEKYMHPAERGNDLYYL